MRWSPRPYGRIMCILAMGATVAMAQGTQTATVVGTVVDGKGAAVAGAFVKLTSPALQGERQLRTDDGGRFRAPLLPPGDYKLVVSKEGLNSVTINQRLGLEQIFSPNVVLRETTGATVEVFTAALAVDKSEFKSAVNYSKETIDVLPVSRNSLLDIAYLAPSVVQNVNSDRGGVQIRGSMGSGNLFLVDGQNVNDNVYNGQRIGIIFDAMEETQILTGALPAEYGDVEGGVVNSISKSGGDDFTADLRWDLNNPSWNAITTGPGRSVPPNKLGHQTSFQIGGPIIKSKLWFFAAGFSDKPDQILVGGDGRAPVDLATVGGSFLYSAPKTDLRREVKLTWAVNDNHSLTASYSNNDVKQLKDYGAGEFSGLTALHTNGEFWSVNLRSILTPKLTMNVRYGEKKQLLEGGGLGDPKAWIIYNEDDGLAYNNGWFNGADPAPDHRNNKTANIKFSYFLEAAGSHQIDAGFDYYQGVTVASGDQGPGEFYVNGVRYNIWDVNVYGLDMGARTATIDSASGIDVGEYHPDKVTSNTKGFYLNDKWTLNHHWNFQLGLRFDSYDGKSISAGSIASHNSFSPRLGVKYDVFGDSRYIIGASYAKYNGRVLETVLQNASYVNNQIWKEFALKVPVDVTLPFSQMYDLNLYDLTAPYTLTAGPINVRIPSNLKPQSVDEKQLTATRTHRDTIFGTGYVKATLVQKEWSNLIDYTQGNSGQVTYEGNPLYIRIYQNNPNATRKYEALELEANTVKGNWTVGGNIVWSSLKGNYVGEAGGSPGRGQGLDFFRVQDGVTMYNGNDINPTGRLNGDVPLRMRFLGTHSSTNLFGKLSWGLAYRFDAGEHYSWTRKIRRVYLNPGLDGGFGSSATQYEGQNRGNHVGNAAAYLDLSVQQDFQLMKFSNGRSINGYLKIAIANVWNHTQLLTPDHTFSSATSGVGDPWVAANPDTFGRASGPSNFGMPRTINVSTGLRF